MKKIVLNISDLDYEKFRFEAMHQKKNIQDLIRERLFYKPFHTDVLDSYDLWLDEQINLFLGKEVL